MDAHVDLADAIDEQADCSYEYMADGLEADGDGGHLTRSAVPRGHLRAGDNPLYHPSRPGPASWPATLMGPGTTEPPETGSWRCPLGRGAAPCLRAARPRPETRQPASG